GAGEHTGPPVVEDLLVDAAVDVLDHGGELGAGLPGEAAPPGGHDVVRRTDLAQVEVDGQRALGCLLILQVAQQVGLPGAAPADLALPGRITAYTADTPLAKACSAAARPISVA